MRILNVHHTVHPAQGGTLEATRQLGIELRSAGHIVEWASMDAPTDLWVCEFSLPLHPLGDQTVGRYGRAPRFIPWLRENHQLYNAVLVHGLWQYPGFATRRALKNTGTPYFVMPHGMLDTWFKMAHPIKHLKKSLYWRLIENAVLRDARAVIFTSEEERLLARETFSPYVVQEKVASLGTLPPTGNPEALRETFLLRYPELRGKRLLLFLGRIHPKKGCDILLKAFAESGAPLHLVFAGPEEDPGFAAQLRRTSAGLPVTFTGMLSGDLKWGALSAAEAFILPSHQENFGMAVAESLSMGTPVLISNKVNIWREIETDGAGIIESDDAPGTLRLLQRWLSADHLAMRAAASRCFASRFDIRNTADNMLALLKP